MVPPRALWTHGRADGRRPAGAKVPAWGDPGPPASGRSAGRARARRQVRVRRCQSDTPPTPATTPSPSIVNASPTGAGDGPAEAPRWPASTAVGTGAEPASGPTPLGPALVPLAAS